VIWPFARPALPPLDAAGSARRAALARQEVDLKRPLADMRWCVVDVETGGLDAARDPLLAIGAVAIERGRIALDASLEVGLTQAQSTAAANILIHGIGGMLQSGHSNDCSTLKPTEQATRATRSKRSHTQQGKYDRYGLADPSFVDHQRRVSAPASANAYFRLSVEFRIRELKISISARREQAGTMHRGAYSGKVDSTPQAERFKKGANWPLTAYRRRKPDS